MNDGNSLDTMLSAFFRTEVPAPWPKPPQPHSAEPIAVRSSPLSYSRFVLAASLLALFVGGWLLAGRLTALPDRPATFDDTTATRPPEFRLGK